MSENLGLGKLITTPQQRDAVHVAVVPVDAAEALDPGEHVGLDSAGRAWIGGPLIGCVDPFLTEPVKAGDRFWLFLFPGSITSLRHDWTHPAFNKPATVAPAIQPISDRHAFLAAIASNPDDQGAREVFADWLVERGEYAEAEKQRTYLTARGTSKRWLEEYAGQMDLSFEDLLTAAKDYLQHGEYVVDGSRYEGEYVPDEFWEHYQRWTGELVPEDDRGSFFSCAC